MGVLNLKGAGEVNISLRNIRKERGLTQAQVAQQSGITVRAYQNYEAGERVPDVLTAIRIANTLRVKDVRKLFGAATPDNTKEPDGNPAE